MLSSVEMVAKLSAWTCDPQLRSFSWAVILNVKPSRGSVALYFFMFCWCNCSSFNYRQLACWQTCLIRLHGEKGNVTFQCQHGTSCLSDRMFTRLLLAPALSQGVANSRQLCMFDSAGFYVWFPSCHNPKGHLLYVSGYNVQKASVCLSLTSPYIIRNWTTTFVTQVHYRALCNDLGTG